MKANRKNYRKILNILSAFLIVIFIVNIILIFLHFDIKSTSIGTIVFTLISLCLPLISLIETVFYYERCLKFLEDAYTINSQLISRQIIFKTSCIIFMMVVQIFGILIRTLILYDMMCVKNYSLLNKLLLFSWFFFLRRPRRIIGGIIQVTKYLRLIQFMIAVNIINERLEQLNKQITATRQRLEKSRTHSSIFSSFSSTQVFLTFERHREIYAKIWTLYTIVNDYFGVSNLFNIVNIFLTVAYNIYNTIVSHSTNLSTLVLADPFQNVSHVCILLIVMVATCRKSDKIVRVIVTDLCGK